jgi:UDP-N-acetylmuramoyl-tripeptide--D-alanyl-D-alanine ligase
MGENSAWDNPLKWLLIISKSFCEEYFSKSFPKYLILEIGADHKGDIKDIAEYVKPNICILTAMQKNLVHGEFFKNREEHIREKKYLADAVINSGLIIYNEDDEDLKKIAIDVWQEKNNHEKKEHIHRESFGKSENSFVRIIDKKIIYDDNLSVIGEEIKLKNLDTEISIKLYDVLGDGYEYALASAFCILLENDNDLNSEEIFNDIELPKSRMRIFKGVNNSTIIDDTYNASPKATLSAMETMDKVLCKGKKILVLGHMAELGEKAEKEEHERIAKIADKIFDKIIFIGRNNHLYEKGITGEQAKALYFKTSDEAKNVVKEIIEEGDLILCKGSQSARVEKVVVEILKDFKDRYEVCRQEKEWQKR